MPTPSCLGQSRTASPVPFHYEHQLVLFPLEASDGLAEDNRLAVPQAKAGRRQAKRGSVSSGESCNTDTLSHGWD